MTAELRCYARTTSEKNKLQFGDNKHHFYLELRCEEKAIKGKFACYKCLAKNPECRTQSSKQFDHGLITEPITETSHIYGSKWYYDSIKSYGEPTRESVEYAEQFSRECADPDKHKGSPPIKEVSAMPPKKGTTSTKRTTASSSQSKGSSTSTSSSSSSSSDGRRRDKPSTTAVYIENNIDITIVEEVEYVKLKEIEYSGKKYYMTSDKNQVYVKGINGSIGSYQGRWSEELSKIEESPEISDEDDEY
jgi:hypothetical protein